MIAYGGRNDHLFVGGIAESVFLPSQPFASELEWQFDLLAQGAGCGSAADQLACLRRKDTATIQATNVGFPFPGRSGRPLPLFYWTPCVDGSFLQDLPYAMYQRGDFIPVPVLYGTDTDEGSTFASDATTVADMVSFLQDNYPRLTADDAAAIACLYPAMAALPNHAAYFPSNSMAYGEATFICPAVNILDIAYSHMSGVDIATSNAATAANTGNPAQLFAYRYNVYDAFNAAFGIGVPHLFEAAAIFGPDSIGGAAASYYSYNEPIIPVVMDYFISFVRALDPNPFRNAGAPVWEDWGPERRRLVFETGNLTVESTPADQLDRCDFWLSLGDVTGQRA